jgi:hypothetical protein
MFLAIPGKAPNNDAEDIPVGTIEPGDESSMAKYSTLRDDKLTVDTPNQIIATEPASETLDE